MPLKCKTEEYENKMDVISKNVAMKYCVEGRNDLYSMQMQPR